VSGELTTKEIANVRTAMRFLQVRCGGRKLLAKALRCDPTTLRQPPSPAMVFRVARMAGVGLDDVLAGKYPPPGVCPHCGHRRDDDAHGTRAE
jgi:hypothetical protein